MHLPYRTLLKSHFTAHRHTDSKTFRKYGYIHTDIVYDRTENTLLSANVKAAVPTHSTCHCGLFCHLTLLFTNTLRQVFFPFFHTSFTLLFIPDLFCRFLLHISLTLSLSLTNLSSLLQVSFSVFFPYFSIPFLHIF